jgi:aspartyl aminopeptidase
MHAVREFVGADDVGSMVDLMKALYNSDLNGIL